MIQKGIASHKVISIPTYPDPNIYQKSPQLRTQFRKRFNIGLNQIVIGTMGGTGKRKGSWELIKILPDIVKLYPQILLLIAGDSTHDSVIRLKQSLNSYNLQKYIKFIGYRFCQIVQYLFR